MDTITATDTPSTYKPGPFSNRDFTLLWTGGTISVFGAMIFETWSTDFLDEQRISEFMS